MLKEQATSFVSCSQVAEEVTSCQLLLEVTEADLKLEVGWYLKYKVVSASLAGAGLNARKATQTATDAIGNAHFKLLSFMILLFFIIKNIFYGAKADKLLLAAGVYQSLHCNDIPVRGINPDSPVWKGSFKESRGP